MTLEEAIKHAEEVARSCEFDTDWGMANHFIDRSGVADVIKCGEEHRQLAEWLKELRDYKEQKLPSAEQKKGRWILTINMWCCSECASIAPYYYMSGKQKKSKYCYVCGAKMENIDQQG